MLYFVLAFRKTVHESNSYINSLMALKTLLFYVLLFFPTQNYVGTALKLQYISSLTSFTFLSDILVKWLPQWTCIEIWVGFLNTYLGPKEHCVHMFGYRAHFEHRRAQNNVLRSNKIFILTWPYLWVFCKVWAISFCQSLIVKLFWSYFHFDSKDHFTRLFKHGLRIND